MMDTIFSLATARGKSGIAIIRLSGSLAHEAVGLLCPLPPARHAALRNLVWQGEVLDQALVLLFEAGASFTGEASAELHLHGSIAVIAAVNRVLSGLSGLRLAEPGEFTRRALENGCIDLTQVEGLADLIDSETESQRKQAMRVLSGAIGQKIDGWRRGLVRAAALVEASIDFADEDVPEDVMPEVAGLVGELLLDLRKELAGYAAAERIRDGFEVAIVGAPNVGKSSLLNALAGRDAAITSEVAGTTRDVIEVRMDIGGLAVTILDTAGLRESEDLIEQKGVSLAIKRAQSADLRIFLVDRLDELLMIEPRLDDIVVLAKADLRADSKDAVSGETGHGVRDLLDRITERLMEAAASAGLIVRERQRTALLSAVKALETAEELAKYGYVQPELLAAELRASAQALEMILGRINVENLLDEIFLSFCIGK